MVRFVLDWHSMSTELFRRGTAGLAEDSQSLWSHSPFVMKRAGNDSTC